MHASRRSGHAAPPPRADRRRRRRGDGDRHGRDASRRRSRRARRRRRRSPDRCSPSSGVPTTGRHRARRRRCSSPTTVHGRSPSTCRPARGSGRSPSTARGTAATRRATCRWCCRHAARLTFTYDDTSHRVAVGPADPPAGVTDADRQLAGTSLRDDLTRERFYFVMADRFENGDPTNDTAGIPGDRLASGFDPTDKGFYHGGDIDGLVSQLDYIQGLGTTAIWLTPAFKNRSGAGVRNGRQRRLPRLLDHRLHADRSRTSAPTTTCERWSTRRTPAASRSSSTSSPTTPPT